MTNTVPSTVRLYKKAHFCSSRQPDSFPIPTPLTLRPPCCALHLASHLNPTQTLPHQAHLFPFLMTLTNPANLVVVITGCDTGFGSEITEDLYQRGGFTIYATCLTAQAVEKYNARQSSRIRAVQVDVTNQEDVDRLCNQVEAECPQGVFCVFNNAGMHTMSLGPMDSRCSFHCCFEDPSRYDTHRLLVFCHRYSFRRTL